MPEMGPFGSSEPTAEERAIEALEEFGASVLQLSQQENFLQIQCKRVTDAFGDEQMELLRPLVKQVRWLDLANTGVTDAGIELVAEMSRLKRLYLQNTSVGDEALAAFAGLEELEYLNLYGTHITDAGLEHLLGCPKLKTLYLWQTDVTEEGVEQLREQLPDLEVTFGNSYFDSRDQSYDLE